MGNVEDVSVKRIMLQIVTEVCNWRYEIIGALLFITTATHVSCAVTQFK